MKLFVSAQTSSWLDAISALSIGLVAFWGALAYTLVAARLAVPHAATAASGDELEPHVSLA